MREEEIIEVEFINKLKNDLKYTYRDDIRDKESLELNFKKKFEWRRLNLPWEPDVVLTKDCA